jgi:hypothetical protein
MTTPSTSPMTPPGPDGHVRAARTRGGIILLDAKRDRYQALYLPDGDGVDGFGAAARDALRGHGLLELASAGPPVSADGGEPAWQDCEPDGHARPRIRDAARFLAALLLSTLLFHLRPFADLVTAAGRRPRPAAPLPDYQAAIARFQAMSLLLPFRMQCLFRAHFLLRFLRGCGLPADWVFGVSLFPFQAHCWVAVGRRTLLDRAEEMEDFVPILVVRTVMATPA